MKFPKFLPIINTFKGHINQSKISFVLRWDNYIQCLEFQISYWSLLLLLLYTVISFYVCFKQLLCIHNNIQCQCSLINGDALTCFNDRNVSTNKKYDHLTCFNDRNVLKNRKQEKSTQSADLRHMLKQMDGEWS